MVTACPRLRDDLITSRQETSEGVFFVVKDPTTRRFFRFREAEQLVARQLDGSTPLETIHQNLEAQAESAVSAEALHQFVEQLRRLGLLEVDRAAPSEHSHSHRRLSGSLLYIRMKAFDPDRLFDRLVGKVWFFFTPWFITLSLAALVTAIAITFSSWDEIVRDVSALYRFDALLLAWVTVLLVTTAHEFAHGLTCKRFGGEVHEIGFLLLYFQPAFYCNISDAWLFPEKAKRLWVTFAGAYFEISVWSFATLTWFVTETDTWVNYLAMIVMATSGIKTFFNLNPLIKLDGYYLLSDYLEIPNLRQKSIEYLKSVIKRLWGSAAALNVTRRERRIYVTYGVLAGAYSYWLLSVIALRFGNYLVDQYQGPGFIAFSGLLMVAFKNPLGRATSGLRTLARGPGEVSRLKRPAVRVFIAVVALAALFFGRMELKVSGEFKVLPVRNADVRSLVDGTIEYVYADEGDQVRAGDVLVRLSERDYRAELLKTEAEIAIKRPALKMLQAGPRNEELALARDEFQTATTRYDHARKRFDEAIRIGAMQQSKAEATVTTAQERLRYARTDQLRYKDLFGRGLVSRKQFEDSEEEVVLRTKELDVMQAELQLVSAETFAELQQDLAVTEKQANEAASRLKLLFAGSRPETIEATVAEIEQLETGRRYLADQLSLTAIVSPASGVVATPKLKDRVGEHLNKGDLVAKVYQLESDHAGGPDLGKGDRRRQAGPESGPEGARLSRRTLRGQSRGHCACRDRGRRLEAQSLQGQDPDGSNLRSPQAGDDGQREDLWW